MLKGIVYQRRYARDGCRRVRSLLEIGAASRSESASTFFIRYFDSSVHEGCFIVLESKIGPGNTPSARR